MNERFKAALPRNRLELFAKEQGVSPASLDAVGIGWATQDDLRVLRAGGAGWADRYPPGAYTFPERDGRGLIVGFSLRAEDGRKGSPSKVVGARRGLIIPGILKDGREPVVVVEGASDVAAAITLGITAIGRPSNTGGAADLAKLLKGREVLIVGENDQKESGGWPGRDGAERVAKSLATAWEEPVHWALPPARSKDIRDELIALCKESLDLDFPEPVAAAGEALLDHLRADSREAAPEARPKQAEMLVRLALETFRIGMSMDGEPFAVPLDGPNVALLFRGSKEALRARLARLYRSVTNTVPSASALADALVQLEGEALECAPELVHLRVAEFDEGVVLDLGSVDGAAVVLGPSGWCVVERSPVLFRRTPAMGALPEPMVGGSLDRLRNMLNVSGSAWPLVVGWLVAALLPSVPHPVLYLSGEHGTGKTSCARFLLRLVDPGPAIVRTPPSSPDDWAVTASASWAFTLDNLSAIPQWLSDAICKACTGDGWLKRALYTDAALAILAFRRVIAITSIDAGSIRPDLADRMIIADLERIPDDARRTERDLGAVFDLIYPAVLGALLDLACKVIARLPTVRLTTMPRMADFAVVLAAMDEVLGTQSLDLFSGQRDRLSRDVLEGDVLGAAIAAKFEGDQQEWEGTAGDLLELLTPESPPKGWPRSARGMGGAIRRLIPPLRAVGIEIVAPIPTNKSRRYVIRSIAQNARSPQEGPAEAGNAAQARAVEADGDGDRPANRPGPIPPGASPGAAEGDPGGGGDREAALSTGDPEEVVEWN